MKDFMLRNDTKLLLRNNPVEDLTTLAAGKKVLFVYGGGSAKKNGCYDDVAAAVKNGGGTLYELGNASRELSVIEDGIKMVNGVGIELIIGAGGAQIMDCAKLIAFGSCHESDLWDYVKARKNPYGLPKKPVVLMPTYPSSGSEYGLGAVSADARTGDFGTAYGIPADVAILVPKYSLSLSPEMTAYTCLVTLVQLCASTMSDRNPVSYDIGISVIRNVLKAARVLKENPSDLDARGVILYGASISTSSRLGLGKEDPYVYELYEVEFVPEVLFGVPYRRSLTTIVPRFLKAVGKYHEEDVRTFLKDAFGYEGPVEESAEKLVSLFEDLGVSMYFEGTASEEEIAPIDISTSLSTGELLAMIQECLR